MKAESAATSVNRSIKHYDINLKLHAVERVNKGERKADVCRKLEVPESTLRGWCNSEVKLRSILKNTSPTLDTSVSSARTYSSEEERAEVLARPEPYKRKKLNNEAMSGNEVAQLPQQLAQQLPQQLAQELPQELPQPPAAHQQHRVAHTSMLNNVTYERAMHASNTAAAMRQVGPIFNLTVPANIAGLTSRPPTVGLVENGLQYARSSVGHNFGAGSSGSSGASNGANNGRNGIIYSRVSINYKRRLLAQTPAIASSSQGSQHQSFPPVAGAPLTPVPDSPRNIDEESSGSAMDLTVGSSNQDNADSEENEPELTPELAIKYGEKFCRWLESCGNPTISRLKILRIKYIVDQVKKNYKQKNH